MAWRIVRQPNGLFARFSDVVDNFTDVDMSVEEACDTCVSYGCDIQTAGKKVRAAIADLEPWTDTPGDGLARFREALDSIAFRHGEEGLRAALAKMDLDYEAWGAARMAAVESPEVPEQEAEQHPQGSGAEA